MQANANDNGTGTALGTSRGQVEAVNIQGKLNAGATNYRVVQGGEVDVQIATGASAYEKVGWQITQFSTDAVQGSTYDVALAISNQAGAIGWKNGILFGGVQGIWPFSSAGVAISCDASCGTLASVLDFGNATITNRFLRGPGFGVDGTGVIISGTAGGASGQLQLNGSSSGTANVFANSAASLGLNAPSGQVIVFENNLNQIAQIGSSGITVGTNSILSGLIQFVGLTSGTVNIQTSATGGHLAITSSATPTNNACAGFSLATGSTDVAGRVSFTSATSCAINFGTTYGNAPFCNVTPGTAATPTTVDASVTTGVLTANFTTAQTSMSWSCFGI
jgi:hypothetical protein